MRQGDPIYLLSEDVLEGTDKAAANASNVGGITELESTALVCYVFTLVAKYLSSAANETTGSNSLTFRRCSRKR